jgi:hypothetical protein
MRNGISACRLRHSVSTNPASSAAPVASEATTFASAQCETPDGSVLALDRPYTTSAIPLVPMIAPIRSKRPCRRADSVSTNGVTAATRMPIGTFTSSTHRHDR